MNPPDRQPPTIRDEDLVARALDALSPEARARVDAALEADAGLRTRFETIAGHLVVYDQLARVRLHGRLGEVRDVGVGDGPRVFDLPAFVTGSCTVLHDRDGDGDTDITGIDELGDVVILFQQQ